MASGIHIGFCSALVFLVAVFAHAEQDIEAARRKSIQKSTSPPLQEAFLSIFYDGRYIIEGLALLKRDGTLVKVRYRHVRDVLLGKANQEFLDQLAEKQDYRGWITVDHLEKYSPTFDSETLALTFTTPPRERAREMLDYGRKLPPEADEDTIAQTSAYLNFQNLFSYAEKKDRSYILDMNGAVCFLPWVLESRFDYSAERSPELQHRDLRLVRDDPDTLTRFLVGEDQSFQPRMLASDRIQGIKYSTEYSMQPNLVTEPVSEFTFLLERDALVEVWINGEEKDLIRLVAGPFNVRNLPLTAGFNEVVLKITDDFGQTEILTFHAVTGPNLLTPGREQYAYSLGVRGMGRHFNDPLILSGFYRRGLTPHLTASLESRIDKNYRAVSGGGDLRIKMVLW